MTVQRCISPDHPSLSGHFPGAPIVPGVVILDEVVAALEQWRGDYKLSGLPTVKFLAPLLPGQSFTILFDERISGEVDFFCRVDDRLIARGRLTFDAT